jgi:archaellum component FlaC
MEIINPQLKELERKFEDLRSTVDHMRGEINGLKHLAGDTSRQTIWQFIIFTITMAVVVFGGLKYQADVLRKEMDVRFGEMQKRIELSEKNMNTRFEDLKHDLKQEIKDLRQDVNDLRQEVRASRK